MTTTSLEVVIPPDVHTAAKRGFIRTTAQAYAASLATGGVTVGTLVGLVDNPDWVVIISTIVVAILSPLLAGLASYLNIISKGIPEAYSGEITQITPIEMDTSYIPQHAAKKEDVDVEKDSL